MYIHTYTIHVPTCTCTVVLLSNIHIFTLMVELVLDSCGIVSHFVSYVRYGSTITRQLKATVIAVMCWTHLQHEKWSPNFASVSYRLQVSDEKVHLQIDRCYGTWEYINTHNVMYIHNMWPNRAKKRLFLQHHNSGTTMSPEPILGMGVVEG